MGILRLSLVITFLLYSTALADWYILIPKKPPERKEKPKKVPLPRLKPNKVEVKPYRIEVRKILSPEFAVRTVDLKKVTKKDLEGKNVVILFLKDLYSPLSELLLSTLQEMAQKDRNSVVLAVDANDSDFPILRKFKEHMGLKRIVLTADSYVYTEFKERLKELNLPSLVVIDKYGFIRFFANDIKEGEVIRISRELERILRSLG